MEVPQRLLLPNTVKPYHYDIHWHPCLDTLTFKGAVDISIRIVKKVDVIVLHSNELYINDVQLHIGDEVLVPIAKQLKEEDQTLNLKFDRELDLGDAKLSIEFDAPLSTKLFGFYKSKIVDKQGKER